MSGIFTQIFPPKAAFTETHLPDQSGKVFVVTGGNAGVGYELCKILFSKNATVYVATRDEAKSRTRIQAAKADFPQSKGKLIFLKLDLADLSTIKRSATEFLSKEQRLDVLWLNAGVMEPPAGSKTVQGYELQLGVNCIGHYLFAKLLTDAMVKTASLPGVSPGDVRAVWVSSSSIISAPSKGGIQWDDINNTKGGSRRTFYGQSKVGDVYLATEMGKRHKQITTVSLNPGLLRTELQRNFPTFFHYTVGKLFAEPIHGAYTEMYAGLSPDITPERSGSYVIPYGRLGQLPDQITKGTLSVKEGGTGTANRFWEYCEAQTKDFM